MAKWKTDQKLEETEPTYLITTFKKPIPTDMNFNPTYQGGIIMCVINFKYKSIYLQGPNKYQTYAYCKFDTPEEGLNIYNSLIYLQSLEDLPPHLFDRSQNDRLPIERQIIPDNTDIIYPPWQEQNFDVTVWTDSRLYPWGINEE